MPVSVIAFDLDGTLIDSNPVKRRGFDHVFEDFKDGAAIVARVLETHRKAFRTVVIRLVLEQLHASGEPGCEPSDERVAELAARYNRFCIDGAVACDEIGDGDRQRLDDALVDVNLHQRACRLHRRHGHAERRDHGEC